MSEPGRVAALTVGAVLAVAATVAGGVEIVDETSGTVHRVEHRVFSDDIELVRVHTDSGRIQIIGGSRRDVDVESRLSGTVEVPELSAVVRDGVLDLSTGCGTVFWDCEASFTLGVPAGVPVEAETGSGDVVATDLGASATLRTSSGDIRVDRSGGELRLSTASGNIRTVDVTAGVVDASSASGNVQVELAAVPDDVDAETASGNVRIIVPREGTQYATEVRAGSGRTRVDVRTDPLSSHRLRASTSSGDVFIHYAGRP